MFLPEVQLIYNAVLVASLHWYHVDYIHVFQMVCELIEANILFGVKSSAPNPACDAQGTVNKIV